MIEQKVWGTTECLIKNPLCELHRIIVKPGGYCSVHKHHGRANVFYVVRGDITVSVWTEGGVFSHDVYLGAGDSHTVEPGLLHQFTSRPGTAGAEVLELYYPVLRGADIERETIGGIL